MSDYESDILEWSEQQSRLLRHLAAGQAVNERPDWANIAEEIASVGSERLHAVESFIVQALAHELKAVAWPASSAAPGWRAEAVRFQQEAAARFVPSMAQRIDIAKLYRRALRILPEALDGIPPLLVPPSSQTTLDALLREY